MTLRDRDWEIYKQAERQACAKTRGCAHAQLLRKTASRLGSESEESKVGEGKRDICLGRTLCVYSWRSGETVIQWEDTCSQRKAAWAGESRGRGGAV